MHPICFNLNKNSFLLRILLTQIKNLRFEIYQFIETSTLDKMSEVSHPLFGHLSQYDCLVFVDSHTKRHIKQNNNILSHYIL